MPEKTHSFSEYHPSWEGCDFNKKEFSSLLSSLVKKKPEEKLLAANHSLKRAGLVMQIWQQIRGWLGFENQTDPVKVNYELLKLLRYGETHHFFDDKGIKELVAKLKEVLEKEEQHKKIAAVIDQILPIEDIQQASSMLDREITQYFSAHEKDLHKAVWPQLFCKQTALISYNHARIHASEEKFDEAIQSLEEAISIAPDKVDWNLMLANLMLANADKKVDGTLYQQALDLLKGLKEEAGDSDYGADILKAENQAYLSCFALSVKQAEYNRACEILGEWDPNECLAAYETFVKEKPQLQASDRNVFEFYLWLAADHYNHQRLESAKNSLVETTRRFKPDFANNIQFQGVTNLILNFQETPPLQEIGNDSELSLWPDIVARYSQEVIYWEKIQKNNPVDKDALVCLADLNYKLNRFEKAAKWQGELLRYFPGDDEAELFMDLINEKLQQGATGKTTDQKGGGLDPPGVNSATNLGLEWEQVEQAPSGPNAVARMKDFLQLLVEGAENIGDYSQEVFYWEKIQKIDPVDKNALTRLADLNYKLNRFEEAAKWQGELLRCLSDDEGEMFEAETFMDLINEKLQQGATGKTTDQKGGGLKPTDVNSATNPELEETTEQVPEQIDRALERSPGSNAVAHTKDSLQLLVKRAENIDDRNQAIIYLQEIQKIDPSDRDTLYNLALHNFHLDKLDEAASWVGKCLEHHSQDLEAETLLAMIRNKLTKINEPSTGPFGHPTAQIFVGGSLEAVLERPKPQQEDSQIRMINQPNPASEQPEMRREERDLRTKLSLNPTDVSSARNLYERDGTIELGNIDQNIKALEALTQAEEYVNDAKVRLRLATLYGEKKENAAAIKHLNAALEVCSDTQRPRILSLLGSMELREKQYGNALRHYQLAIDSGQPLESVSENIFKCYVKLATQSIREKRYEDVLTHYREAIEKLPSMDGKSAYTFIRIANLLLKADPSKGMEAHRIMAPYLESVENKQESVAITLKLAAEEKNSRKYRDAIGHLERARAYLKEIDEDSQLKVLTELADCYIKSGDAINAQLVVRELNKRGEQTADFDRAVAHLHKFRQDFEQALVLFRQLGDRESICDCLIGIAAKAEDSKPHHALGLYHQGLAMALPAQKQRIAEQLISLGSKLAQQNSIELALACFNEAVALNQDLGNVPKQQLAQAYTELAQDAIKQEKYSLAETYYEKALEALPYNREISGELTNLGLMKQSMSTIVDPKIQESFDRQIAKADQNFEKGLHDPKRVRDEVRNLVIDALAAHGEEIQKALGTWLGSMSTENRELQSLASGRFHTPDQIFEAGTRAGKLLERAYDGVDNHMPLSAMPEQLRERMQKLRRDLRSMIEYYEAVKTKTETLMGGMAADFWAAPELDKLSPLAFIEARAKKALQQIERHLQLNPAEQNPNLEKQIGDLKQQLSPKCWINQAISEYQQVCNLSPNTYGRHCQRLIDAYLQAGEHVNAMLAYEQFKSRFPAALLQIDPTLYLQVAQNENERSRFTDEQLFNGCMKLAARQAGSKDYDAAIKTYQVATEFHVADPYLREAAKKLMHLGDLLMSVDSPKKALKAYESMVQYIDKISLVPEEKSLFYGNIARAMTQSDKTDQAIKYYKKAIELNPTDVKNFIELSDAYSAMNDRISALAAVKKAYELNSEGADNKKLLFEKQNQAGDQYYVNASIQSARETLAHFVQDVTMDAPYAAEIRDALGSTLGWYSLQNQELRRLGEPGFTSQQVEKQIKRAIELIEAAYDGEKGHLPRGRMPEQLEKEIDKLKQKLEVMQKVCKWIPLDEALLTQLDKPSEELYRKAIAHYQDSYTLMPENFGEHCNRIISAYGDFGNPETALKWHHDLKEQFGDNVLLAMDSSICLAASRNLLAQGKYKDAISLLARSIAESPADIPLKKGLSRAYTKVVERCLEQESLTQAYAAYQEALKCGVEAEPGFYSGMGNLYTLAFAKSIHLQTGKKLTYDEFTSYQALALDNLKMAADLQPNNAQAQFEIARLAYFCKSKASFDPLHYMRRAFDLDDKNINYAYGLLMWLAERRSGMQEVSGEHEEEETTVHEHFKELGGDIKLSGDELHWGFLGRTSFCDLMANS